MFAFRDCNSTGIPIRVEFPFEKTSFAYVFAPAIWFEVFILRAVGGEVCKRVPSLHFCDFCRSIAKLSQESAWWRRPVHVLVCACLSVVKFQLEEAETFFLLQNLSGICTLVGRCELSPLIWEFCGGAIGIRAEISRVPYTSPTFILLWLGLRRQNFCG